MGEYCELAGSLVGANCDVRVRLQVRFEENDVFAVVSFVRALLRSARV